MRGIHLHFSVPQSWREADVAACVEGGLRLLGAVKRWRFRFPCDSDASAEIVDFVAAARARDVAQRNRSNRVSSRDASGLLWCASGRGFSG